jgi:hypothetical protein
VPDFLFVRSTIYAVAADETKSEEIAETQTKQTEDVAVPETQASRDC